MNDKKTILSGIQPTGVQTLGSYCGALKNWAELSLEYNCFYAIVDMHAITIHQVPEELRRVQFEQLAILIACGIDPLDNTLFIQSHVPAHAQLAWVLSCFTMYGELRRMTQFKDKSIKHKDNINAGLFTYPALQAADILLYKADLVPVGADQKQHVELTRDIAARFNGIYGDIFKLPEAYIPKVGARIMDLQVPTRKMSKSESESGGCVLLLDTPDTIIRAFKRAVTDSETSVRFDPAHKPGVSNLIAIYSICTGLPLGEIEREFEGRGYGDLKSRVGEAVVELLRPIREEAERLIKDKAYLEGVMKDGRARAAQVADRTVREVYNSLGFIEVPSIYDAKN